MLCEECHNNEANFTIIVRYRPGYDVGLVFKIRTYFGISILVEHPCPIIFRAFLQTLGNDISIPLVKYMAHICPAIHTPVSNQDKAVHIQHIHRILHCCSQCQVIQGITREHFN